MTIEEQNKILKKAEKYGLDGELLDAKEIMAKRVDVSLEEIMN